MKLKELYRNIRGRRFKYKINVKSNYETVKFILNTSASVIRLGDGEFDIMRGKSIPYQKYDKVLANRLKKIVLTPSNSGLIICLPDIFNNINRYTKKCRSFYNEYFFYQNRSILSEIERTNNWYGSTFISRPYIDLKDKSNVDTYFKELKQIWEKKELLIIEGKYTRSGEGNDLFSNASSISRIVCPSKDAFSKIDLIEDAIKRNCTNKLVLLMLGPTAKLIVDDFKDFSNQFIDLGHIDSEYEWFKMGTSDKVKIPHKHTAEFNNADDQVDLIKDSKYNNEIIEVIE